MIICLIHMLSTEVPEGLGSVHESLALVRRKVSTLVSVHPDMPGPGETAELVITRVM